VLQEMRETEEIIERVAALDIGKAELVCCVRVPNEDQLGRRLQEVQGFETWLVNARDVKHLPGRPKTDRLDAVWLCKVAERQMLRPSFVPPPQIRRLRDLTRYRIDLVAACTAEKQRVEKLLEAAQIKMRGR
jgi:transposase